MVAEAAKIDIPAIKIEIDAMERSLESAEVELEEYRWIHSYQWRSLEWIKTAGLDCILKASDTSIRAENRDSKIVEMVFGETPMLDEF